MLGDPGYASKREKKKAWYPEHGALEGDGGSRGLLLVTDDAVG
ncbi:hypothetical protein ACF1BN_03470 [Streptomyces sp. NPDC014861]